MIKQKFIVEMKFLSGWADAEWMETDDDGVERPLLFNTKAEAHDEITDHVQETKRAAKSGFMADSYKVSDFRVVPYVPKTK